MTPSTYREMEKNIDPRNSSSAKSGTVEVTIKRLSIVPEEGWFDQPKYSTPKKKILLRCVDFCFYFLQSKCLFLISINLLVVYRESVNLIGYITRRLSADSQQL